MISMRSIRGTAALLFLAALAARADEAALTRRALELRANPGDAGASVAQLPAQAPVTRLDGRQGPWVQVRTAAGATGWVHLFDLGPANGGGNSESGASGLASNALRGVTNLFGGGGAPRQTAGSTAGIRGLEAEALANAQPNPAAVQQMAGWRQSESEARAYADRAPWKAVDVPPLPAASRAPATGNGEQLP